MVHEVQNVGHDRDQFARIAKMLENGRDRDDAAVLADKATSPAQSFGLSWARRWPASPNLGTSSPMGMGLRLSKPAGLSESGYYFKFSRLPGS